jgi:hypothetical protein
MAKLECAICGSKDVKYELFITTFPDMLDDMLEKDLCENCARKLADEIKWIIKRMREFMCCE